MNSMSQESLGPSTSYFDALLGRIRAGDERAKEELIHDAYPRVIRLTRFILRGKLATPACQTDDICSISYEKFARKLNAGLRRDFATLAEMMGYLARIIKNTALDEVRKVNGPEFQAQFPAAPLPTDDLADRHRRVCFYEMIEDLPDDEQAVIELKYLHDRSNVDIATILRLDRKQVAAKLLAGISRLKRQFDAEPSVLAVS